MSLIMLLHSLIGTTVVCTGALALLALKGSTLHRVSGLVFTGAILLMGFVIAAGARFESNSISSLGVLFVTFMLYLVITAWLTMRQSVKGPGPIEYVAPVIALSIAVSGVVLGIHAVGNPNTSDNSPPTAAYFFFAILALIAMILDAHHLRSGGVRGKHRYVRHIWRMSCALFFATSSLFTGPGSVVFQEWLRESPVLSIPQNLVILLCLLGIYKVWFRGWRPRSKGHKTTHHESQGSALPPTMRES